MRILHTADWHVGRTLRNRSRAEEHEAVLAEIASIARAEKVDLVLVAGDLFDQSSPSPEAERLVYRALLDLARDGTPVVAIAGNHDHPKRLQAVAPLLQHVHVFAAGTVSPADQGGVLHLDTRCGERACIALVPFLSQKEAVRSQDLMSDEAYEHTLLYQDLCSRVFKSLCSGFTGDTVNLLMAHVAVLGGTLGGGERQAHTIMEYFVQPQMFPESAQYVALGHLHAPQDLTGRCPIWYSGSPMQLDFGETQTQNGVLLVDVSPRKPARVTRLPLTSGRKLRVLKGTLESLRPMVGQVGDDYLKLVLDELPRVGLADEAREMFPTAVDVVVQAARSAACDEPPSSESFDPMALFESYLDSVGRKDPEVLKAFEEMLGKVHETAEA